jgi:hypothetical protein
VITAFVFRNIDCAKCCVTKNKIVISAEIYNSKNSYVSRTCQTPVSTRFDAYGINLIMQAKSEFSCSKIRCQLKMCRYEIMQLKT